MNRAATAAPMAPATPKLAALTIAAEVCVAVEAAPELVELQNM